MVCGPQRDINRLEKLQERAVKIIDNNCNRKATLDGRMRIYKLQPISQRQDEHLCSLMYRLSKDPALLNHSRPRVRLRCHHKIKFKKYKRTYQRYLKSPLSRGTSKNKKCTVAILEAGNRMMFFSPKYRKYNVLLQPTGPTKKKWRSDREANREANCGKLRQNSANFVLKKMAITFLKNRDRSHRRGHSRKQWRSLWR